MFNTKKILFLYLLAFFIIQHVEATTTKLSMDDLIAAAIPTLRIFDKNLLTAPADITFGTADLKYDHGQFKIIECGNGPNSAPATHPVYINDNQHVLIGPYWDIIEHMLDAYQIPTIFVGRPPFHGFKHFSHHERFRSFDDFTHSQKYCSNQTKLLQKPTTIREHLGIVIHRASERKLQRANSFYDFKNEYPAYLLVNANSNTCFFGKDTTYKLFEDAGLSNYIPRYAIYPAQYESNLAEQIKRDLGPLAKFIIKPTAQTFALGVGLTTAENLDSYLKYMFGTSPVADTDATSIGYWRTKKETHFLVSEFAPSQPIMHRNKTYEPTMRIIFLMTHEQGTITVNITGGIWKIPPTDLLNETASLTDRYVTNPARMQEKVRIMIEQDDLKTMKTTVAPVLAQLYKTMLQKVS